VRVLVVGATGLIGSHLVRAFGRRGWEVVGTTTGVGRPGVRQLDLLDGSATRSALREIAPDVVVCAAANPYVDLCEREPAVTRALNVDATLRLGVESDAVGARFVFLSSDYVFDGESPPYDEGAKPAPLNVYGQQKRDVETAMAALPGHLLCRTSGVFGTESRRKNFVWQVVDRLRRGEDVQAATDQRLAPTSARVLASAIGFLLSSEASGLFHVAGDESPTRAEFARLIARTFALDEGRVRGTSTAELGLVAKRPRDSTLRSIRLTRVGARPNATDLASELRDLREREASGSLDPGWG
jgi:dTDP-4-dehydrorhamnose reductase